MKYLLYLFTFLSLPYFAQSQDYFTPLNGPYGAKFSPLCLDSSGYLYSINDKNEVIRSNDYGDTWELFNDGVDDYSMVLDIKAAPNGNVAFTTYNQVYLLKNGEATWKPLQFLPTPFNGIVKIAFNEESRLHVAINKMGIFRDTTWGSQQLFLPIFQNDNFYCEKLGFFGDGNNFAIGYFYGGGGNVVLKISENGDVQNITPSQNIGGSKDLLFVDQGNLLVATNSGLWKYDVFEQEWIQIIVDSSGIQNGFNDIVPVSDNEFYLIGEPNNYHSNDYGNTFTKVTQAPFSLITKACFNCPNFEDNIYPVNSTTSSGDGIVFFSNAYKNQTLLRSFDFGQHWDYIDLQYKLPIVSSTIKDSSENLFAQTLGIHRTEMSQDDGTTWNPVLIDENNSMAKLCVDESSNFIYAIDHKNIVHRSNNLGVSWDTIFNNPQTLFPWNLSVSPKGELYLYNQIELYASTNNGNSWSFLDSINIVNEIAWHPDGTMFALTGFHVLKSEDDGYNWTAIDVPITMLGQQSKLHITSKGIIFFNIYSVGMTDVPWSRSAVSWDDGETFELLNFYAKCLTSNSCGDIITFNGPDFWISEDYGNNWLMITNAVDSNASITNAYIDDDDYIYLSLSRGVVYKSTMPSCEFIHPTSVNFDYEDNLVSSKISPNPFKNSFKLEIENNFNHHLKFQLNNQSGIKVIEKEFSGNSLEIKRNDLPNGIYYYHVYLGEKIISTGKVIAQ